MRRSTGAFLLFGITLTLPELFGACTAARRSGFETPPADAGADTQEAVMAFGDASDTSRQPCGNVKVETKKPTVDIIFVIDNSGSMKEEINQVKANVNTFANKIANSGLDYKVFAIVKKASSPTADEIALCVPPPLGGPNCTDNPPFFYHIDANVQSKDSFKLILSTYETSWRPLLRPEAHKIFVEVTDDESDTDEKVFDEKLLALKPLGTFGTKDKRKYTFHSICAWDPGKGPPPSDSDAEKCGSGDDSYAAGIIYQRLSLMTGGIVDSVCKNDYSGVLDNLALGISKLACDIPYPNEKGVDAKKMVIEMTLGDGKKTILEPLKDRASCDDFDDAWYYDDPENPKTMHVCPGTCGFANANNGTFSALAGCTDNAPK